MLSPLEKDLISQIAHRAHNYLSQRLPLGNEPKLWELEAEITMVHEEYKLRLGAMLEADEFNFWHDILGIRCNLNRTTGKLGNCFLPRFAA